MLAASRASDLFNQPVLHCRAEYSDNASYGMAPPVFAAATLAAAMVTNRTIAVHRVDREWHCTDPG